MTPEESMLWELSTEMLIPADSAWWPKIAELQRRGLVKLRWPDGARRMIGCYVSLTDAGWKVLS